ncbi:hypothetical protein ACFL6M_05435 [Candidatus Eisenbacteria bacterium]|uniref:Uncharacterized protein n=1 Tax=Eiseniibacteriota bacterium TaxID=2212470 RepID=A0ABV6YLI6_UNCEI
MKRVPFVFMLVALVMGGANAQVTDLSGGAFIAHYVPEIINSEPPLGWCGQYDALYKINNHSEQNIRVDTPDYMWTAWYVLCGFAEDKQFCGCQFGVTHEPYIWGFDTGSTQACWPPVASPSGLELPSGGWPGTGEGTALTSTSGPWDGNYMAVYLMTGYAYGYGYSGVVQIGVNGQTGQGGWTNCEGVPVEFVPEEYGGLGINADGVYAQPLICCPTGACCFPDGTCQMLPQPDCEADPNGEWAGGTCDPNPCPDPSGACCFPDGRCEEMPWTACDANGGDYQGDFTLCDPNPCPQPPGACCYPDGVCQMQIEADCGGTWMGMGTVCDPNPCIQPDGACCFADGSCLDMTAVACTDAGGQWQGYGTDCGPPNPCQPPLGACCYPNGICAITIEAACDGDWLGMDTVCDPNPCPQPTVCCVLADCYIVYSEAECTDLGGDWYPDETTCDPNPCPPTPIEGTSWGSIKALYR